MLIAGLEYGMEWNGGMENGMEQLTRVTGIVLRG